MYPWNNSIPSGNRFGDGRILPLEPEICKGREDSTINNADVVCAQFTDQTTCEEYLEDIVHIPTWMSSFL